MVYATSIKPILSWAGNKFGSAVADRVSQLYEPFCDHIFVEPFAGCCGMTMAIQPKRAMLHDLSCEIIGLHKWVKYGGTISEGLFGVAHTENDYYQRRREYNTLLSLYRASPDNVKDHDRFFTLLLWLNKCSHGCLYRVNQSGIFNTPLKRTSKKTLPTPQKPDLSAYRAAYGDLWWFYWQGYEASLNDFHGYSKDLFFIYCDPPYWGTFNSYTAKQFSESDQRQLLVLLSRLDCPIVVSNAATPETIDLYTSAGYTIEYPEVKRSLEATGKNRGFVKELLAYRNLNNGISR